jgi:hypothetical protein
MGRNPALTFYFPRHSIINPPLFALAFRAEPKSQSILIGEEECQ